MATRSTFSKMTLPHWLVRFLTDLKRKQFWPLKALNFLIYGGMFALFPFLTLHARSLGITGKEMGALYGVMPILGLFAPPLAGMLADKLGNFKILMSVTFAISGLSGLLFLTVPTAKLTYKIPTQLPIAMICTEQGHSIALDAPFICNYTYNDVVDLKVTKCKFNCPLQRLLVPLPQVESPWCSITKECHHPALAGSSIHHPDNSRYDGTHKPSNYSVNVKVTWSANDTQSLLTLEEDFCPDFIKIFPESSSYNLSDSSINEDKNCRLECSGYVWRTHFCSNNMGTVYLDPSLTLGLYLPVRIFHGITLAISLPLWEGATMAILKEHEGDFGFQRIYISIGMIVMTPISGLLIDLFSDRFNTDYRPAFFLYCGMNLLSALAILFIDLKFKKPAINVLGDFIKLLIQPKVMAYLIVNLISGIGIGLIETFLFWLLDDMGADKSLMGITVMVGAIFGIPMLIASVSIIEKLGHVNTICLGLTFYVVRLTGYANITNPWMAMPFEAMECFTVSLLSVASVSYAAALSSPSTMTSLQGMQAGIVHGVGRGAGSLMGGLLSVSLGIRNTFQMMAIVCGVTVVLYGAINYLMFEKNDRKTFRKGKNNVKSKKPSREEETSKDETLNCDTNEELQSNGNVKNPSNNEEVLIDGNAMDPKYDELLKDANVEYYSKMKEFSKSENVKDLSKNEEFRKDEMDDISAKGDVIMDDTDKNTKKPQDLSKDTSESPSPTRINHKSIVKNGGSSLESTPS